MHRTLLFAVLCLFVLTIPAGAAQPDLAVNQWVKLPDTFASGYIYSGMVYAAERGQVLHWGAVAAERGVKGGNDVRAFDAAKLAWASDYPSDPGQTGGMTGGGASASAISFCGKGRMLKTGRPYAAMIVNAVTYDTKRKQAVYSMPGLMVAYDPATKKWIDLKAKTLLHGKTLPGGPPVYGAGMCYDPVNDEIVMFPQFGAQSADMRSVTGRVDGHLGTLRYSYKDNTWRRVGAKLGTPEMRKKRQAVIELLGKVSSALDTIYEAKRRGKVGAQHAVPLRETASDVGHVGEVGARHAVPLQALAAAAKCVAADDADGALREGTKAIWALEALLDTVLALEPPRRAIAPMVYDAKNKCIVMFGGDSGRIRPDLKNTIADRAKLRAAYITYDRRLNDTWIYDCKTRNWRNISTGLRPPPQQVPMLHYDPVSGLVLLVTIKGNTYNKRIPRKVTVWSLDVAKREWSKRSEHTWDGPIDRRGWYSSGIDPKQRLLIVAHTLRGQQTTWVMKYDLAKMPPAPAPKWMPAPPITPTVIPKDDPAWIAKLKALPANQWVAAKPPVEPNRRDWGSIACDPIRGWMVYFGGGHSTYQGTDVAIYQVGANRWVHQAGGHNDSLPPVGWGGYHVDAWGGNNAGHMRNQYVALDGRMHMNVGFGCQVKPRGGRATFSEAEVVSLPAKPHGWFYDIDRGGVWRQLPTEVDGTLPKVSRGRRTGAPYVVDPAGKIYGFAFSGRRYSTITTGVTVYRYDVYARKTKIIAVPKPWPNRWPEGRPFCILPDKGRIFLQDYDSNAARAKAKGQKIDRPISRTWAYDIKANKFIELKPANQPEGKALGTAYIEGQDAVIAIFSAGYHKYEQWVYSFGRNKWVQLPFDKKSGIRFQAPYCQMDYVAKHGVLVNFAGRTHVMRPDISKVQWE
jgi:hypothetical protein